jgi:hypothetical protein
MCLQRERKHANQVTLRILQLERRYRFITHARDFPLHCDEGPSDIRGIDASASGPQRTVCPGLDLTEGVVREARTVAHFGAEPPHQSQPSENEI